MERTACWCLPPSRGTAPGVPARWLFSAWRDAAEHGGPACVLAPYDGVLVLSWVNRAMSELMGRDTGDLVGHPLRDFAEPEGRADRSQLVPLPSGGEDGDDVGAADWSRLAHRLARSGGGTGIAWLRKVDGSEIKVKVEVLPVQVPDRDGEPDEAGPPFGGVRQPVPNQGRVADPDRPSPRGRPADGPADEASATGEDDRSPDRSPDRSKGGSHPIVRPQRSTVTSPGIVGELPAARRSRCWFVRIDPPGDALAEAQEALNVAEHRFRALAGCAPVGIFASEAGLRLGYVNEHFVQLTEGEAHTLLGTGWLDAVHGEDLPSLYTAVQSVLAGTSVELTVRLAHRRGVQRWLQLRLAPTTTPARAAGFIGTAEDVTQRRSWEEHLTYQAQHDPLTGLVNRRRLIDVLTELLSSRRGRDREFAVLFLDLDGFKEVNDTLGHDAGDRALIEVARRMQRVARETDVLARVAGDEFVVVLRSIINEAEAEAAARRLLAALADPLSIGTKMVSLSASIGVALPAGFDTPDSLLRAADRVMYEAKAAGHGLYRLAPVGPDREGR